MTICQTCIFEPYYSPTVHVGQTFRLGGEGRARIVEVTGRREQYGRIFIRQPTHVIIV